MNAAEIIAGIRSLPLEEKGKVVQFVHKMTEEEADIAAAVEEGLADIAAGRSHTQEEAEKLLASWFGK